MKSANLVILVVYKSKQTGGIWKSFCAPYGVTTQAGSFKEAKRKLEELVSLYEEGLKKYNYPANLVFQKLTDKEDQKVLDIVWKAIVKKLSSQTEKSRNFLKFAKQNKSGHIKIDNTVASFYQPTLAI